MLAFRWSTEISQQTGQPRRPLPRQLSLLALALCLQSGVGIGVAVGQPVDACIKDDKCKDHYTKAVSLYSQEQFDEALTEFQAAYAARAMPLLLVNMGRTLQKLGRPKDALSLYERYLTAEAKPEPETRKKVEGFIAQVKALIGPDAVASAATKPLAPPPPPPPPPGRPYIIAGAVAAAVGVAGIATAGAFAGLSAKQYSIFQDPNTIDEFDKRTAMQNAQADNKIALGVGIAGAAVAAAGGALIGLGVIKNRQAKRQESRESAAKSSPAEPTPAAVPQAMLVPLPSGGALVVQGGF